VAFTQGLGSRDLFLVPAVPFAQSSSFTLISFDFYFPKVKQ